MLLCEVQAGAEGTDFVIREVCQFINRQFYIVTLVHNYDLAMNGQLSTYNHLV